MNQEKRERVSPPAIGGSSLLTVFAVLALTVFALLSLSTVKADVRLANAADSAVTDYYAADGKAQAILARLRSGEMPEDVALTAMLNENGGVNYYYAVPISATQELQVEVLVEGTWYEILRWQAVPSVEWEGNDGFIIWDGE